jgi:iron complex outermembrane receptor protein
MTRLNRTRAVLCGGAAALALVATSVSAQELAGGAGDDEEIVVTARKVEEKLLDVPIAVTALSGAALEARGIGSVTELARVSPNLQFTPGQGGNSGAIAPFIRGVGENDFIITSDPAVGTYFDGVYVARTFGASAELLDVERIEVLRGPQGSLFGKNTIGGAINVIGKLPGDTTEFTADARYGSYNNVRVRARVALPLGEGLSISLSGLGEWGDGWQHIQGGETLGNRNVITGKAVLRYQSGPFEAIISADGLRRRQNSAAHSMIAFVPTFFSGLQSGFIAPCCTVPSSIDQTETTPALNHDEADAFNTSLTLSYELGAGKLKSITAWRQVDALFGRDGDASATVNYAADIHDENAKQFSQELQYSVPILGEGNLLLGAYYYREKSVDLTRLYVADGLYNVIRTIPPFSDPAFPGGPPLALLLDFNLDFDNRQTTTNYGVFGNMTLPLGPKVTLELGGRYTREKKTFYQGVMRIYSGAPLLAGTPNYTLEDEWDAFTPRVSLSWKPQDNLMLYGSWSRGFRSGGFNGRPTSLEEVGGYNPERLDSYELGLKGEFDGILTVGLAGFYNQYRDQQLLISTISPATGLIVVRTENAGRSRIYGLEFEAGLKLTPRLRIDGSLGILDAKYQQYTSVIAGVPTDVSFRTPKQAPSLSGSLGVGYTLPLGDTAKAVFRVDTAWRTKAFIDVENTPELAAKEHALVNASATFDLPINGVSLRLAVDNLTNQRIVTAGYDARGSFGFVEAYFNEPRRYWVTLAYQR